MPLRWKRAAFGAFAALVWGALEPVDKRIFDHDYSDVAVLGKWVTRGPEWLPLGLAIHAANGAIFGLVYHEACERLPMSPRRLAVGMALAEHVTLYPLGLIVDRAHPARGEPGVASLIGARPLAQGLFRHLVFGLVLGSAAEHR